MAIAINGNDLSLTDLINVARHHEQIQLSPHAINKIKSSEKLVEQFVAQKEPVYGITTGFGKFSNIHIPKDKTAQLQVNLIRSHACGVGNPLSEEETRAAMLLRINALAKGASGIKLVTLDTLIQMLNKGVHPVIPEKGSLGASGDLAPLAHMVLVMIGEGQAIYKGKEMAGDEALKSAGITKAELGAKEGLALINGTPVLTAVGAISLYNSINLSKWADIIAALTLESLNGISDAFDSRIHELRNHSGQIKTASNIRRLIEKSEMTSRQGELRVQDAYSLRCIPQVHGACKDCFDYVKTKVEIEINSVTDNPLIMLDTSEVISGGNFHGEPLALPFDYMAIGIAELANISERRLERMVNPQLSEGLPAFLTPNGGLNSGFMIVQYSAAALVSENKILAHPASVDSIPSSANQEDIVSMGSIAARKSKDVYENSLNVLAMEYLAAQQAIKLRGKKKLGLGTNLAFNLIESKVSNFDQDEVMNIEIKKAREILENEGNLISIENQIGELE